MTKIAVLFTNYGPYHIARVSAMHQKGQSINWEIIGIELGRLETEYGWKVDVKTLPFQLISVIQNHSFEQTPMTRLIRELWAVLDHAKPDAVAIAGYSNPAMLAALAWCRWHGKTAILLSATAERDAPRSYWRELPKSWIIRQFQSALVGGKPQKRYLINLGFPESKINLGYDVVENDAFHPDRLQHLLCPLKQPYFLAINRFVPKKNLSFLLSAYAAYRQVKGKESWHLVLCGDGPLRSDLEQKIAALDLKEFVHLPGFLQQDEMLPYFAHASCFVHASIQEQWGLVVNEAMAAGLPVLVSDRCGCFEDLVTEGINGFGFDPENAQELTDLMLKMSSSEVYLESMGQASLEHIQKFSPTYFADSLVQAVEYATIHSRVS